MPLSPALKLDVLAAAYEASALKLVATNLLEDCTSPAVAEKLEVKLASSIMVMPPDDEAIYIKLLVLIPVSVESVLAASRIVVA
jgi:hypothetical protein